MPDAKVKLKKATIGPAGITADDAPDTRPRTIRPSTFREKAYDFIEPGINLADSFFKFIAGESPEEQIANTLAPGATVFMPAHGVIENLIRKNQHLFKNIGRDFVPVPEHTTWGITPKEFYYDDLTKDMLMFKKDGMQAPAEVVGTNVFRKAQEIAEVEKPLTPAILATKYDDPTRKGSLQRFIPNTDTYNNLRNNIRPTPDAQVEMAKTIPAEFITGLEDRNRGNYVIDKITGQLYPIDMGFPFGDFKPAQKYWGTETYKNFLNPYEPALIDEFEKATSRLVRAGEQPYEEFLDMMKPLGISWPTKQRAFDSIKRRLDMLSLDPMELWQKTFQP